MKTAVEYLEYMWPMRHYLITCGDISKRTNIIAVSFCMPVSKNPPLIVCAIGKESFSCGLIENRKEFVVNVPTQDLRSKIYYCGFHSGNQVDKFKETGLTAEPAWQLRTSIVSECVAHMECRVIQEIETGDKKCFVGQVIEAYANKDIVGKKRKIEYATGDFPRKVYAGRFQSLE